MIPSQTSVGPVALTVRDIDAVRDFYERAIGLMAVQGDGTASMVAPDGQRIVELVGDPDAPPRPRRTTGLYHVAILVPTRQELARSLRRLIEAQWRLVGASDHLVSEALYLEDPEGNGIEIYRDRPRTDWNWNGDEVEMATGALDLHDLMRELDGAPDNGMPAGTRIGHVHLHVADLTASERFYGDLLGFDVTARGYPGALFMSAGGYHHHLGLNTWVGEGAPRPPQGSAGLRDFEIQLPHVAELGRVGALLSDADWPSDVGDDFVSAADPSGNQIVFSTRK